MAVINQEWDKSSAAQQVAIEQAFLIKNMETIAKGKTPFVSNRSLFEKTIMIQSRSESGILNKLSWIPGAHEFTQLTTDKMSQLVPMIRLYKVEYNDSGEVEGETEVLIPDGIETNILSDTTDQGVGIKNFQYRYIGSNPATVRNDIEAKLTLYFQNFSEMLRVRKSSNGKEYSFIDLFSRARRQRSTNPSARVSPARPAGLATLETDSSGKLTETSKEYSRNAIRNCTPKERDRYNPIEFEMKIVVGWAYPTGISTLTKEERDAISNSRQAFFLTLVDHEFSFENDGSFSLELNYRARLGAIMESHDSDILRLDLGSETIPGTMTLGIEKTWTDSKSGIQNVYVGTITEIMKALKYDLQAARDCCDSEAQKFITDRLNRLEDNIRTYRYQKLGDYLFNKKMIKMIRVNASTMNSWANHEDYPPRGLINSSGVSLSGGALNEEDLPVAEFQETRSTAASSFDRDLTISERIRGVEFDAERALDGWSEVTKTPKQLNLDAVDSYHIMFFPLGDLLEYCFKTALLVSTSEPNSFLTQNDADRIKFLLGTINIDNKTYNIVDVPISLLAFRNFWFKKVVKPRRERYPILQFVRDVIRDLVFGAVNSVYYTGRGNTVRNKFQLRTAFLSLPEVEGGKDPIARFSFDGISNSKPVRLDTFNERNPLSFISHKQSSSKSYHYLVIFAEKGSKDQYRRQEMINQGYKSRKAYNREVLNIHTFGFGEDRGILKKANFSKTDQPYLREARFLERGNDPWIQLSNVYNVKLDLFGAPFFYPGHYIYVNPFGLSKSRTPSLRLGDPDAGYANGKSEETRASFANIMGIGGYHIIIDVTGVIEDGKYEVQLNTRYDNSGDDTQERRGFGTDSLSKCPDEGGNDG